MNIEKVIFSFFIVLAFSLNFGFVMGDFANPDHHNLYELFATIVVNLIATVLKFGERTQIGAVLLATSLVADLELIAAAVVWTFAVHVTGTTLTDAMPVIVSLAGGALVANAVSVVLLVVEMSVLRR